MSPETAVPLTAEKLRERFPSLSTATVRLDGPAGSQVPQQVIDAIAGYLSGSNANLGAAFAESLSSGELFGPHLGPFYARADLLAAWTGGRGATWFEHGTPPPKGRTATFALTLPGAHPRELAETFAQRGIAVGAGDFHAPGIFDALHLPDGAIRMGFLHYNTAADVDAALAALAEIAAP